ncbi:MAG: ATP-binding protein [Deltaproteobacteria bacterium]
MRLGFRGRLFVVSLCLVSLVGLVAGLWLESVLRDWLETRLEATLVSQARTVREAIEAAATPYTIDAAEPLVDRIGEAAGVRVTLIAPDGQVLADSSVPTAEIARLENHGRRPEVVAAQKLGRGVSRRFSRTLETHFLYVAIPVGEGTLRVSMPLEQVDSAIANMRFLIFLAGLVGLAVAVLISFFASNLMSRRLRRMVGHARALVRGDAARLDVASTDEFGRLAGSINRMAEELEATLATLARERGRFETVLDSMSDAVLALDGEQRITLTNTAAKQLLKLESDVTGQRLADVVAIDALNQLVAREPSSGDSEEFSMGSYDAKDKRTVLARARPLTATGGTVVLMLDVTEMRRLERIRRDFVANVSHELKTPVSVVRANAETLLDGGLEDGKRARSFVDAIYRNAERLSRIITDLLELSRIEAGRYDLDLRVVDVRGAAHKAVDAIRERAERAGIEVTLIEGEEAIARVDQKALTQVLNNLLENAVKYTESGGHVQVRTVVADENVRITVEDDGPGIAPKYRTRIFERFYRIDKGRSRATGGTGLGLSIVKHYVESMRGSIGVDAREPNGSIFWVELPSARMASSPPMPAAQVTQSSRV